MRSAPLAGCRTCCAGPACPGKLARRSPAGSQGSSLASQHPMTSSLMFSNTIYIHILSCGVLFYNETRQLLSSRSRPPASMAKSRAICFLFGVIAIFNPCSAAETPAWSRNIASLLSGARGLPPRQLSWAHCMSSWTHSLLQQTVGFQPCLKCACRSPPHTYARDCG